MNSLLSEPNDESEVIPRNISAARRIKKVFVAGDSSVGKTSLLSKAIFNHFPDFLTCARLQDSLRTLVKVKNAYPLEFIFKESENTNHNVSALSEIKSSVLGTTQFDAIIYVYSIDSRSSFKAVKEIRKSLYSLSGDYLPAVLVGNKKDWRREVSRGQGKVRADDWRIPFFEVSAKEDPSEELNLIFDSLAKQILEFEDPERKPYSPPVSNERRMEKILLSFQLLSLLSLILGLLFLMFGIISSLFSFAFMVYSQNS